MCTEIPFEDEIKLCHLKSRWVPTRLLLKLLLLKEKSLNPLDSYQNPKLQKSAPFVQNLLARKLWLLNKKFLNDENGITADFLFRDIITHRFLNLSSLSFFAPQSSTSAKEKSFPLYKLQCPQFPESKPLFAQQLFPLLKDLTYHWLLTFTNSISPISFTTSLEWPGVSSSFPADSKSPAILPLSQKPLAHKVAVSSHLQMK